MSRYHRARLPGVPIFFTVALASRGSHLLIQQIDTLRDAVRATRAERPFAIKAWMALPDHLHCAWRLPEEDCDYSTRWRLIKARFSRSVPMGKLRESHVLRGERGFGSEGFGVRSAQKTVQWTVFSDERAKRRWQSQSYPRCR